MSVTTYTADFGSTTSGGFGSISFQQMAGYAKMTHDIDFSNLDTTDTSLDTHCSAFSYHIHDTAGNLTTFSTTEADCDTTGGHYVPNQKCSAIVGYGDQENFEIGDLSGRFGNLPRGEQKVPVNFPELIVSSLADKSITVHCVAVDATSNGQRRLCAPLVMSQEDPAVDADPPTTLGAYHAYFGAGNSSDWFNGYVRIEDGKVEVKTSNTAALCAESMSYHIHSAWPSAAASELHYTTDATQCGETLKHYDPFLGCGPASEYNIDGRDECTHCAAAGTYGARCTGDFPRVGYGCELGDLSGRFDKLPSATGDTSMEYTLDVMPPAGLTDFAITFHCGATRPLCGKLLECPSGGCVMPQLPVAPEAPTPTPTPTPDDSSAPVLAGSTLLALVSLF